MASMAVGLRGPPGHLVLNPRIFVVNCFVFVKERALIQRRAWMASIAVVLRKRLNHVRLFLALKKCLAFGLTGHRGRNVQRLVVLVQRLDRELVSSPYSGKHRAMAKQMKDDSVITLLAESTVNGLSGQFGVSAQGLVGLVRTLVTGCV